MITKLIIKNFRKFTYKELTFDKGVNVILGDNEAGKSTIMAAIIAALFTDPQTKAKQFWGIAQNWQTKSNDLNLELNIQGADGQYRLVKDLGHGKQRLEKLGGGRVWEDPKEIAQVLQEQMGIPNQQILLATSFVRQSEISNIQFSEDLRGALQNVTNLNPVGGSLGGGMEALQSELQGLRLGLFHPSKRPGPIKAAQEAIALTQEKLTEKRQLWDQYLAAQGTGEESGTQLGKIRKDIQEIQTLLDNNKKLEEGKKQLAELEKNIAMHGKTLEQINREDLQIKQIQAEIDSLGVWKDATAVDQAAEKLVELKKALQIHQEQLVELQDEFDASAGVQVDKRYLKSQEAKRKQDLLLVTGMAFVVVAVAFVAIGKINEIPVLSYAAVPILLTAILLLLSSITGFGAGFFGKFLLVGAQSESRSENNTTKTKAEFLTQQIEQKKSLIISQQKQQLEIATQFQAQDVNDFFAKRARFNTSRQELDRLKSTAEAYLNGQSLEDLETEQSKLLAEKRDLETNVLTAEVKASELSPSDYLRKRRDLDMLLVEEKRLDKDTTKQEVITEQVNVSLEEITDLEEQLEILASRLEYLQKRATVLDKTIGFLQEVVKSTSLSASKLVSQEVEKYLPLLTNDHYKQVRLDDNYNLQVFVPELEDWVDPLGRLSLGTVDQLYFLTRIALSKTILGSKINYLFLDDPFVTFDENRLAQTHKILNDLGQNTQIFLFSHNKIYKDWGNTVTLNDTK